MDKFITIDNLKTHYTVSGEGAPLVLMHGWGCNTDTVKSIADVASKSHTVYNIDLPGFGKSQEPPQAWDTYRYAEFVAKFIDELCLEKPSLIGHSFGGRLSIIHASAHDVDKVILVDSAGVKPQRSFKYYYKVYTFKAGKWLVNTFLPKEKARQIIENKRKKAGSADYSSSTPIMRAVLSKVVNQDLRHLMPKITAPTLLVWGENDTATPMRDARIMEKLIPGAGLVSFPGCSHYSFLDNPRQFAAVLQSFLQS